MQNKGGLLLMLSVLWLGLGSAVQAQEIKAVQLYTQDELINMINRNEHLDRVVMDRCRSAISVISSLVLIGLVMRTKSPFFSN